MTLAKWILSGAFAVEVVLMVGMLVYIVYLVVEERREDKKSASIKQIWGDKVTLTVGDVGIKQTVADVMEVSGSGYARRSPHFPGPTVAAQQPWSLPGWYPPSLQEPVVLEETWSPEKIVAYRAIAVTVGEGDPDGIWMGFPHPDGGTPPSTVPVHHPVGKELTAQCDHISLMDVPPCVESPGDNCQSTIGSGCGFYAYKTREQAGRHAGNPWGSTRQVVAKVLLSGKVIEHEKGYRAQTLEVVEHDEWEHKERTPDRYDWLMNQWITNSFMTRQPPQSWKLGTNS